MPRAFPSVCPPKPTAALTEQVYQIQFITPLFGGGVKTKEADPLTRVRVPSIRGQLRFWWRATMGRGCATRADLYRRESEIWGDTKVASRVRIRVERVNAGQVATNDIPPELKYVLFPFEETTYRRVIGASFDIHLNYPSNLETDVSAAVKAWTNFGGLGSRTRRGCGALFCQGTAPQTSAERDLQRWWTEFLDILPPAQRGTGWPIVSSAPLYKEVAQGGNAVDQALRAWKMAVDPLRKFRQGPDLGRNEKPNGRPGRSRWPEADSLRAKTGSAAAGHGATITVPGTRPAFPRSLLGLPIVFQFPLHPADQPNAGTLYPGGDTKGRMASPIILKPWRFANGRFAALCVFLSAQPPANGLTFKFNDDGVADWAIGTTAYLGPDLARYRNSPMTGRNPQGIAPLAFVNGYLINDAGFTKLT